MKRLVCLIAGSLTLLLLVAGCAANPPGLAAPRSLTDAEKQTAIQTALGTQDVKLLVANGAQYTTDVGWAAIVWQGTGNAYWKGISSDWATDSNRSLVPASARYYIDVHLSPNSMSSSLAWPPFYVDIDPDSGKVVLVQDNPFGNGNGPVPVFPGKPIPPAPLSPPLN